MEVPQDCHNLPKKKKKSNLTKLEKEDLGLSLHVMLDFYTEYQQHKQMDRYIGR